MDVLAVALVEHLAVNSGVVRAEPPPARLLANEAGSVHIQAGLPVRPSRRWAGKANSYVCIPRNHLSPMERWYELEC